MKKIAEIITTEHYNGGDHDNRMNVFTDTTKITVRRVNKGSSAIVYEGNVDQFLNDLLQYRRIRNAK